MEVTCVYTYRKHALSCKVCVGRNRLYVFLWPNDAQLSSTVPGMYSSPVCQQMNERESGFGGSKDGICALYVVWRGSRRTDISGVGGWVWL